MSNIWVHGKSRKPGDVYAVPGEEHIRYFVVTYNDERDEYGFEEIRGVVLRALAPEKYQAALGELRRAGGI